MGCTESSVSDGISYLDIAVKLPTANTKEEAKNRRKLWTNTLKFEGEEVTTDELTEGMKEYLKRVIPNDFEGLTPFQNAIKDTSKYAKKRKYQLKDKTMSYNLFMTYLCYLNMEFYIIWKFGSMDDSGDKKISVDEIVNFYGDFGENFNRKEAERQVKEFDKNGDKLIDYKEFHNLMISNYDPDEQEEE